MAVEMLRANVPSPNTTVSKQMDSHSHGQVSVIGIQDRYDTSPVNSTLKTLPATHKNLDPEVTSINSDEQASKLLGTSEGPSGLANPPYRERWNSLWLRTTTLMAIAVAIVSILITTVVLNRLSASQHGLPVVYSSNRYLWAYLPTTVFVALAALWHQVDHQCRLLAPWNELLNGPAPADKTLLLDYISPLSPVVLWKALRNHHWAVAASTTASVLLDVCILFSTSLLSISLVTLTVPAPDIPFKTMLSTTNTTNILNQPDSAFVYYGVNTFQIEPPLGSNNLEAYEVPDFDQLRSGTYSAEISTFQSGLVCSIATTSHSIRQSVIANITYPIVQLNISTPQCETHQSFRLAHLGLDWTRSSMQSILGGDNRNVTCQQQDAWSNTTVTSFFIVDMLSRYESGFTSPYGPGSEFDHVDLTINTSTVLLCKMAAALAKQPFQFDTITRSGSTIVYNSTNSEYVDASLLQQAVFGTLDTLGGTTRPGPQQLLQDTDDSGLQALLSPFVAFINVEFHNYNLSIARLTDAKWLYYCAGITFNGLVAQIARTSFSSAMTHTYDGTRSYQEYRVLIQLESTAVIGACLLLIFVLIGLIIRYRPWNVTSRDPSSVLGLATILASSPTLNQLLQHKSTLSDKELGKMLQQTSFRTSKHSASEIQSDGTVLDFQADITPKWWRPIWARPIVGAAIVIYTLALVAALETIQRVSRSSHPLVVSIYPQVASLLGSSLPALLLIGAKLLFVSLAGCVAMFSPFATILGNQYLPRSALLRSSIYKMPIINVIQSLRVVQPNVALASFAAVCGGFLTIFASGLLVSDFNVQVTHQPIAQLDTFNITSVLQINSPGLADKLFSITDQFNASGPSRTWKALVYPTVDIENVLSEDYWYGNVTIDMPAVRGSLNCTFVSQEELEISFVQSSGDSDLYISIIHDNKDVPANCMLNNTTYRRDNYSMVMGNMNQAYAASFRQWSPSNDRNASVVADEQFPNCPNLLYILGYFDMEAETATNVSAMYCYQTVEQVQTNTTFNDPQQHVSFLAPIVNESSVIVLQDRAHYPGMKWFSSVTNFNESHDLKVFDSIPVRTDVFTQHLILGVDGIPFQELAGPENQPRLLTAVQHLYGKYMVQPIDLYMRVKTTGTPTAYYNGTVSLGGWTKIRFTQSETSKLALQVLLSVMVFCGILAYVLTPMREVLMHSPYSIAGTMTLLAGSRLCSREVLPEGSEFLSDKELDVLLSGYVFVIGWSEEEEGEGEIDEVTRKSEDGENERPERSRRKRRYGIEAVERR